MLALVQIPGFGPALAGLDWLELPGLDGKSTEIKQLGRGVNASWQYLWTSKGIVNEYVAFVTKSESKNKPVAAAALVRAAIPEELFLSLVDIGDSRLWLFAVKDGVPVRKMDRVGEAGDVMGLVSDFLTGLPDKSKVCIYTDQPDLFERIHYTLEIRSFSLDILGHSIKQRDYSKAAFSRHSSAPLGLYAFIGSALILGVGYYIYDMQAQEAAIRDAAQIRQRAIAQRKIELDNQVSSAINATVSVRLSVPAYLKAMDGFPRSINFWKLSSIDCAGQGCTLVYKAQAFATWAAYLKAMPKDWPAPIFDDIERVTQFVPVQFPSSVPRTAELLPRREAVSLEIGNLAQISKQLGLILTLPVGWTHVAGNTAESSPDEQWVPVAGTFDATGSAVLLKDLAKRLPEITDVTTLGLKLDDEPTFDFKGKAYANP